MTITISLSQSKIIKHNAMQQQLRNPTTTEEKDHHATK